MSDAEVVDLTLDSDEECGAAKGGAAAPAPAAARRRAHAFAGSQEEDVVIVSEKPGSPTRVAARKAAESCLDLTVDEDVGRLIGGVPKDPAVRVRACTPREAVTLDGGVACCFWRRCFLSPRPRHPRALASRAPSARPQAAAARLLQRTQELERELLEARCAGWSPRPAAPTRSSPSADAPPRPPPGYTLPRKHAQRHAGPGVQAPAHWKLQQQARGDSHRVCQEPRRRWWPSDAHTPHPL